MPTIYTNPADPSNPHNEPSFAEEAAAAELGRSYIHPLDRNFEDRPPPDLQPPDDVDQDVVEEIGRHRIAQPRTRVPV